MYHAYILWMPSASRLAEYTGGVNDSGDDSAARAYDLISSVPSGTIPRYLWPELLEEEGF